MVGDEFDPRYEAEARRDETDNLEPGDLVETVRTDGSPGSRGVVVRNPSLGPSVFVQSGHDSVKGIKTKFLRLVARPEFTVISEAE